MTDFGSNTLNEFQRHLLEIGSQRHSVVGPFLREHGRFFDPQPLPKGIRRGTIQVCFANSYRLLKRHGKRLGLAYCEGYTISAKYRHCYLHAWCVDHHGRVYDPTPTGSGNLAYLGVAFKTDYVINTIKERETGGDLYFGFLDDWAKGHPLIKELGDRPEIWKHQWNDDGK